MFDTPRDRTLSFLAQPYRFIDRQCRHRAVDAFETRLLFEKTVCMRGAEAARVFYGEPNLLREGAAPEPVQATLFGKGGVQGLDGEAHRARKALFLAILAPENTARLARRVRRHWERFSYWAPSARRLPLYETAQHVLTLSVCEWLGVPIRDGNLAALSADVSALFAEAAGPGHLRARRARRRLERWLTEMLEDMRRASAQEVPPLLRPLLEYREPATGEHLASRALAVELLNIIRPVVAVSVYIVWMAHALLRHQEVLLSMNSADSDYRKAFIEEVRRFYPFFPVVMARVKKPFSWREQNFEEGMRVMLDLHGTNRDPVSWHEPDSFRPERFLTESVHPYAFIPHGGGDAAQGHRCPGEGAAAALMLASLDFVLAHLPVKVDVQKLGIAMQRLPAMPETPIYIRQ